MRERTFVDGLRLGSDGLRLGGDRDGLDGLSAGLDCGEVSTRREKKRQADPWSDWEAMSVATQHYGMMFTHVLYLVTGFCSAAKGVNMSRKVRVELPTLHLSCTRHEHGNQVE